jgi:hypothetical protein
MALKFMLPPAAIVVDVERPVIVMPVPVTATFENVSVPVPLLCSVIGCELLFPTTTFVNATLVGLAEICAWRPEPVRAIVSGDPGALFEMETVPLAAPVVVGANVTVKDVV